MEEAISIKQNRQLTVNQAIIIASLCFFFSPLLSIPSLVGSVYLLKSWMTKDYLRRLLQKSNPNNQEEKPSDYHNFIAKKRRFSKLLIAFATISSLMFTIFHLTAFIKGSYIRIW